MNCKNLIKTKNSIKGGYTSFLLLLCLIFMFSCKAVEKNQIPTAKNGIIDLKKWDIEKNGPVDLNGYWKFYWKEFKHQSDLKQEKSLSEAGNIFVPGVWNQSGYKGLGYGTYHLKIVLPDGIDEYALKFNTISTAYKVYVDDELIFSCGEVGKKPDESKPDYRSGIATLKKNSDAIDLILHVSNYHYMKGGVWETVHLGSEKDLNDIRERSVLLAVFLFGSILIMGLYHLGLFVLRRNYKTPLYFAFFCFCFALRNFVTGEYYIIEIFPNIPFHLIIRLEYMTMMFGLPPFAVFMYSFFRKYFSILVLRGIIICSSIFIIITIVFPPRIFTYSIIPFEILILFSCFYSIYVIIRSIYSKIDGSIIFMVGFAIFSMSAVNDVLYSNHIIETTDLTTFGFLIFIFSQSIILSSKFSKTFTSIENLSYEINEKNRELIKLDELKDEFLANTSHELRTPLNGIIGIAESLIDGVEGDLDGNIKKDLSLVSSSGKRLSSLINDILDFSKLKSKDLKLLRRPIDIKLIIDIVLSLSKHLLADKSIELKNEVPQNFPFIFGDENRIQQVLHNLVSNAIENTNEGAIVVSAKETSIGNSDVSFAEISVSDTGFGLADERLEMIRNFFNLPEQKLTGNEGVGFGFAICKSLIDLHNGKFMVDSKLGEGSVFSFTIPFASGDSLGNEIAEIYEKNNLVHSVEVGDNTRDGFESRRLNKSEVTKERRMGLKDRREFLNWELLENEIEVLVVDDDLINLQVISNTLRVANINSITASSGAEALKILKEKRPDIILLDIMMPRMSGFEAAKKIREVYTQDELPIIFLTAKNQVNDLVEGFASGANDYITKPFSKNELITRLKFHVNYKHVIDESKKFLSLEKELEVARRIQQSTVPGEVPKIPGLELATTFIPMEKVGGDFYDYFVHSPEEISILISDVSGHGVPAALIASMIKIICNLRKELTKKPNEFFSQMNSILKGNIERQYLTSACAYIDLKNKMLYYSNAGHMPLIILRNKENILEYKPAGKLIGIYESVDYELEVIEIFSGDRILLYTDGITEAIRENTDLKNIDTKKDMFGVEKLHESIVQGSGMNASEYSEFLMAQLRKWTGTTDNFRDDLTYIVVDIL